jgi:gluconolactonase
VLKDTLGRSGIYYCKPDGSHIEEVVFGGTGYNGIGLSPDGKTLYYAMNYTGRLFSLAIEGPGKVAMDKSGQRPQQTFVGAASGNAEFDGLKVTKAGNICIGTNRTGGITTISSGGEVSFLPLPETMVTNLAFGGNDLRDVYMTLSTSGRLARLRWDEPGLKLNFG